MANDEIIVDIENVGIFKGKHSFNLKKGLNILKAPNAKGKTSFTRALELLLIPTNELKGKGYYMNLFANSPSDKIEIKIKNDKTLIRRFRKPQNSNNLLPVSDDPFPFKGLNMVNICFAIPENELMNSILYGKSIRDYIEEISGSKAYDAIIKSLEKFDRNYRRQYQIYRDDLIRLDETQKILKKDIQDRTKFEKELNKLPEIKEETLIKDKSVKEVYTKTNAEKIILDKTIREKKGKIESLKQHINDLKEDIKRKSELVSDIEREHPKILDEIDELLDLKSEKKKDLEKVQLELNIIDDQIKGINDDWVKRKKYGEEKCYVCGQPFSLKQLQEREKNLENAKKDYTKQKKQLEREIDDHQDEIEDLQKQERTLSIENSKLTNLQTTSANRESEYDKLNNNLKKDIENQAILSKKITKLLEDLSEEIIHLKEQRERLEDRIQILEGKIVETQKRIKILEEKTKDADIITNKIEFLEEIIKFLKIKKDEIIENVANRFNQKINEIYKKLGYSDFKEINIKKDYKVYIIRERDGILIPDFPLEALSTSERYTIGIIFIIAAKEEYLPEFPFFVIDEIITSYDDDRMQKIKEYVANVTDYVIITQLSPESSVEELTVEHVP